MFLAHFVACIDWAHAKGLKETDSYPPNYPFMNRSYKKCVAKIGINKWKNKKREAGLKEMRKRKNIFITRRERNQIKNNIIIF